MFFTCFFVIFPIVGVVQGKIGCARFGEQPSLIRETYRNQPVLSVSLQGDEILDTDIPCELEAKIFVNTFLKVFWVLLQPLFYALRPFFVNPKAPTRLEHVNLLIQVSFDAAIWYFWGAKPVVYLVGGTLLAMGLHPVAGLSGIGRHWSEDKCLSSIPHNAVLSGL